MFVILFVCECSFERMHLLEYAFSQTEMKLTAMTFVELDQLFTNWISLHLLVLEFFLLLLSPNDTALKKHLRCFVCVCLFDSCYDIHVV